MNREQRRHPLQPQRTEQRTRPTNMQYGHNGEDLVLIKFDYMIDHVWLRLSQVDDMLRCLNETKQSLAAHLEMKKSKEPLNG